MPTAEHFTHRRFVYEAGRWLRGPGGCCVVIDEPAAPGRPEVPDAIGWRRSWRGGTVVIEAKVSRPDFLANRHKKTLVMGRFRYFLTPGGLIDPRELPPGWGLLEAAKNGVTLVAPAADRDVIDPGGRAERFAAESELLVGELCLVRIIERGGTLRPTRSGRRVMSYFQEGGR